MKNNNQYIQSKLHGGTVVVHRVSQRLLVGTLERVLADDIQSMDQAGYEPQQPQQHVDEQILGEETSLEPDRNRRDENSHQH